MNEKVATPQFNLVTEFSNLPVVKQDELVSYLENFRSVYKGKGAVGRIYAYFDSMPTLDELSLVQKFEVNLLCKIISEEWDRAGMLQGMQS